MPKVFNVNSVTGNAAGLVALVLLAKPRSADQNAIPQVIKMAAGDKTRIQRVIRYIINRSNGSFAAYRDGADMMALSMYLRTGGPDQMMP